jgi:hypothetical protein
MNVVKLPNIKVRYFLYLITYSCLKMDQGMGKFSTEDLVGVATSLISVMLSKIMYSFTMCFKYENKSY